ncbi:peptidase dimerization domain-containing protein [Brevibacillus dissolubilis]|uniref:peptidase dimerization domain-containing protein n=1 Tax=Brevibacillus dissolubilis TaxID=1844116 RepID=UPI001117194A|nr:peptidase dimerization domain-containing protein [Brevibacillus dissolubilis]
MLSKQVKTFPLTPVTERIELDLLNMTGLTSWHTEGKTYLLNQMEACDMEVMLGNKATLLGKVPGKNPSLPSIVIGSHMHTTAEHTRYDGLIGLLAGLEIARCLKETGTCLHHTLEIINGTPSADELQTCSKEKALYLEIHTEQGPVLKESKKQLGVVTGISGVHRFRVTVEGETSHAGSTPMNMRRDALVGAAQMVVLLESICQQQYYEHVVGTVENLQLEPNLAGLIPGRVEFDMDIRSTEEDTIHQVVAVFLKMAEAVAATKGLRVKLECISKKAPLSIREYVQKGLAKACNATASTAYFPSGADYDNAWLASVAPVGMIFIPGMNNACDLQADPASAAADLATGVEAMARALMLFDEELLAARVS